MARVVIISVVAALLAFTGAQRPIRVSYNELNARVQITGRFGEPVGTYLKLEGVRTGNEVVPSKGGSGDFRVERVNGRKVTPFASWVDREVLEPAGHAALGAVAKLPAGTRCTVEGYETGSMIGIPEEVLRRSANPAPQALWQFEVHFVAYKVSR